jgi:hypothetical protein
MTPERLTQIRNYLSSNATRTTAERMLEDLLADYEVVKHEVEYLRHENAHLMKLLPEEAFPIYTSKYARERTDGTRESFAETVERISEAFSATGGEP